MKLKPFASSTYRRLRKEKARTWSRNCHAAKERKRLAAGPGPVDKEYLRFVQIRIVEGHLGGHPAIPPKTHFLVCLQSEVRCDQYDVTIDGKPWKRCGMARLLRAIAKRFPAVRRLRE
jgi:hypothetical protein